MNRRQLVLWTSLMLGSGVMLGSIAEADLPYLLKEAALLLPLQAAALIYVAKYWRDRKAKPDLHQQQP